MRHALLHGAQQLTRLRLEMELKEAVGAAETRLDVLRAERDAERQRRDAGRKERNVEAKRAAAARRRAEREREEQDEAEEMEALVLEMREAKARRARQEAEAGTAQLRGRRSCSRGASYAILSQIVTALYTILGILLTWYTVLTNLPYYYTYYTYYTYYRWGGRVCIVEVGLLNSECPLCLDDVGEATRLYCLPCGHGGCEPCIGALLQPVGRPDLRA